MAKRPKGKTKPVPGLASGSTMAPGRSPRHRGASGRPAPPVAPPGPPAEATRQLEEGMLALQRHEYQHAAQVFSQLLESFPRERGLADRARVYLELCAREQAKQAVALASAEERLTAATAALNNEQDAEAERLSRSVLAENPEHDLALYLLAAVEARRGMVDAALQYLSQAVAISPEASVQARHDPDFTVLRGTERFEELTEPPPPAEARPRRRRGRAER